MQGSGSGSANNYLEQSVQLNAPSSRLRAAALAAAKYKSSSAAKSRADKSNASVAREQQDLEQTAVDPSTAVEVGDLHAVYAVPRRSRANAEEASFLVCP